MLDCDNPFISMASVSLMFWRFEWYWVNSSVNLSVRVAIVKPCVKPFVGECPKRQKRSWGMVVT